MTNKFFWSFFLLLNFAVTLPLSWWLMAKADFFYPGLYDAIGIEQHIQRYAPKNQFGKADFVVTSKEQRVQLFQGVVEAIHNNGVGLKTLAFKDSNNQDVALFTEAEIIHLQDVANLLKKLKPVAIALLLLWLGLLVLMCFKRPIFPSGKQLLVSAFLMLFVFTLILLSGPERIFNQLHVLIFPDEHQWFFYYEESLMSTMMMAPILFGYLAAIWALLSILLSVILLRLITAFPCFTQQAKTHPPTL